MTISNTQSKLESTATMNNVLGICSGIEARSVEKQKPFKPIHKLTEINNEKCSGNCGRI